MLAPTRHDAPEAGGLHRPVAPATRRPSPTLQSLFLAIVAVGALHMGEQLLFGIEEFYMLRDAVGRWQALFPPAWADQASVLLITLVGTALSLLFYALVFGTRAARWVVGGFGVLGVTEAHHWLEALVRGGYDPGLVTSVAYVAIGALIVRELWRGRGATVQA
jgi:hypothetical protein